jgi:hypothetical protein
VQLLGPDEFPEASMQVLTEFSGDLAATAAAVANAAAAASSAPLVASQQPAGRGSGSAVGLRVNRNGIQVSDVGTETPTHFIERHVDRNYEWNEWALRRKALQILRLREAATTSTQTDQSHFRRENDAQVYLPKDNGTQTGISVYTSTRS